MNDPITIEDIQRATGLGERAVRAWIRRLRIVPVSMRGRVHLYPSRVVSDIQAAQIQKSIARRKDPTITLETAAAETGTGIITVKQAKRLAGRRAS
jgi:hypothetical protein